MDKTFHVSNLDISYTADYRKVKHPRLEFKTGNLLLVIPNRWHESEAQLLTKHQRWIQNKYRQIQFALQQRDHKELHRDRNEGIFRDYVRAVLDRYLSTLKLEVSRVRFREMRTKWASCSSQGKMTFNTLLRFLPDPLISYIIFHEVAHLKERRHNQAFWNLIERNFKNREYKEKDLTTYWFLIQKEILQNTKQ